MINISEIFKATNGTREFLEFSLSKEEIDQLNLADELKVKITLLRVEEGIMLLIDELSCELKLNCVKCNKEINVPLKVAKQEWLYYSRRPKDYDDENEFLFINKNEMVLDPVKAIRQELLLNCPSTPHCQTECAHFKGEAESPKALAGLKELWESSGD